MQTTAGAAGDEACRQAYRDRRDVREQLMQVSSLKAREKETLFLLLLCLSERRTVHNDWVTHVSNGWLEARSATSAKMTQASLKVLEDEGWIVRIAGPCRRIDLAPTVARLLPGVRSIPPRSRPASGSQLATRQLSMALPSIVAGTDLAEKRGDTLPRNGTHTLEDYPLNITPPTNPERATTCGREGVVEVLSVSFFRDRRANAAAARLIAGAPDFHDRLIRCAKHSPDVRIAPSWYAAVAEAYLAGDIDRTEYAVIQHEAAIAARDAAIASEAACSAKRIAPPEGFDPARNVQCAQLGRFRTWAFETYGYQLFASVIDPIEVEHHAGKLVFVLPSEGQAMRLQQLSGACRSAADIFGVPAIYPMSRAYLRRIALRP